MSTPNTQHKVQPMNAAWPCHAGDVAPPVDAVVLPVADCLATALQLAQADDWSAATLSSLLPRLSAWAGQLRAPDRVVWQHGLRQLWARHGWGLTTDRQQALFALACDWDDWPLAIQVGETLAQRGALPDSVVPALAQAYWQLGKGDAALRRLYPHLVAAPQDEQAYRLHADVHAWCGFRESLGLDGPIVSPDDALCLEPLGGHHLRDFAWQYQDPSIARLCCLPAFDSDRAWLDWLHETYGYGDQLLFAVLHREWGFVGVVSLILHRGAGFFYYWVGPDFQGQGIGPAAVSLMLQLGQSAYGMHACYAKAFADNYPSRRGLRKLGFAPMAIEPDPPHAHERFYRWGDVTPPSRAIRELALLLQDMGSELRLPAPAHLLRMDGTQHQETGYVEQ